MLNSKEIAQRALLRAEEIKAERKQRQKQASLALIGVSAMVMVAIVVVIPAVMPASILLEDGPVPLAAAPLMQDANAVPYEGQSAENQPQFNIPGYGSIIIPANTTDVPIVLLNPDENTSRLAFEIVLAESEETLYTSGLINPAMCIEYVSLAKALPPGEHPIKLIIRSYELESLISLGSATVEVILIAE